MVIRDFFNWRQLNFKWVINYITIHCHNTSKEFIKKKFKFEFWPIKLIHFIQPGPVIFRLPSWIIVQLQTGLKLGNQMAVFYLPSWILDQSETICPPSPHGVELSVLSTTHYDSLSPAEQKIERPTTLVTNHAETWLNKLI